MKYDIFISYRRKDSSGKSNVPTARQFKLAFEAPPYNYKVFFDYSECTDNYFSEIILPAIRSCDFFVLVLTKDCLLRCSNEGDWVRREIEEAIAYNRKIIPITPDKECESFPLGLPDSLSKTFDGLHITTVYTDHMFEASVDFLVKNRFHLNKAQIDSETERKSKDVVDREKLEREKRSEQVRKTSPMQGTTSIINGHEYVDLGLPSGTLWATCNVGANKPEDYGDYLSWGEGKTIAAKWGYGWYMPTKEQWKELMQNTNHIWTARNGVYGRLFKASNGNSLFMPAAGFRGEYGLGNASSNGYYWSSSLRMGYPNSAWYFNFYSGSYLVCYFSNRSDGRSVRAVCSLHQN